MLEIYKIKLHFHNFNTKTALYCSGSTPFTKDLVLISVVIHKLISQRIKFNLFLLPVFCDTHHTKNFK